MKKFVLGVFILIISFSVNAADPLIDNGNGTVTNAKTGLMWKKCSEGQRGNNCSDNAKTYVWKNAMKLFKQVSFAGYHNWRIPTKSELKTIVHSSKLSVFPRTPSDWYWSSSPYSGNSDYVHSGNFSNGTVGPYGKGNVAYVRLVRNVD